VAADAVDWAGILARDLVRETVAARLGDFSATVDIAAGEPVAADIILIPFGSSVQGVNYQLRSNTLPSLMLVGARARLGEWAGRLRGLPVSFLARRIDKVRAVLEEKTAAERIVKTYKLSGKVDIQAKNDADVIITLDSPEYRFWIEGYLDIARHDSTAAGRAHLGRLISSKDEIFLEVTLYTDIMKWNFDPGLSRRWGKTTLSFLYRMPGEEDVWRLSYDFSPKWRLQLEKTGEFSRTEAALRYRIHEFLALEFVLGSDKENYLRLIGNL
jgi:hypothetical protein